MAFTKHTGYENRNGDGSVVVSYISRSWETQKKPYHSPLQFAFYKGFRTDSYGYQADYANNTGPAAFAITHNQNLAYEKLAKSAGDTATQANNLLEGHETVANIVTAATSLGKAANNIRHGNFGAAAKNLGLTPKQIDPRKLKNAKSFGDKWLQYHFGWEPLVQDIGAGIKVLNSDFGSHKIRGSSTDRYQRIISNNNGGGFRDYESIDVTTTYKLQQEVRISNPNLYLANQMGFVNPLSVAWEAVPYSFVVDWFANVGQILSSMSDFVGMYVTNPQTLFFQRGTRTTWYTNPFIDGGNAAGSSGGSVYVTRDRTILGPTLELKPFNGFSVSRGATAIALLLQKL